MGAQNDSEGLIPLEPTGETSTTSQTNNSTLPVSPSSPAPPYQSTGTMSALTPAPLSPRQPSTTSTPAENSAPQESPEKPRVADDIAPTVVSSSRGYSPSYSGQPKESQNPYPVNSPDDVKGYPGQPQPTYANPAQQAPSYLHAQGQPGVYYTPYGPPSGYASATPLHALQSAPAPVDCPSCGHREMTRAEAVTGMTTHGWAAVLCCCCCLGCFPYLMSSLKDVDHYCGKCGVKLACWHNSGRVQVMQTGGAPGANPNANANRQSQPQPTETTQTGSTPQYK